MSNKLNFRVVQHFLEINLRNFPQVTEGSYLTAGMMMNCIRCAS